MSTLAIRLLGLRRSSATAWWSRRHAGRRRGRCWRTSSWRSGPSRAPGWPTLVFGDADDPRGALRWTLAQLRRALGVAAALREIRWSSACRRRAVDVLALAAGDADPALVRGELLEGIDPGAAAEFDAWLLVERRRLAGVGEAVLRDAALARAGRRRHGRGSGLAARASR